MEAREIGGNGTPQHEVADFSPREPVTPEKLPRGLIEKFEQALAHFSKWTTVVAGVALVVMLALSLVDVIGNKLFHHPLAGTPEFVAFLAVIVTAFAMGMAFIEKAHVQVEVFTGKLPPRGKAFFESLVTFFGLGFYGLLFWFTAAYGTELRVNHELSMTQRIPVFPLVYAFAFACLPVCFYLILEMVRSVPKVVKK